MNQHRWFFEPCVGYGGNSRDFARIGVFERLSDDLDGYQPFHAARAEYLIRFGRDVLGTLQAYDRAIELTGIAADRAFLVARRDRNIH